MPHASLRTLVLIATAVPVVTACTRSLNPTDRQLHDAGSDDGASCNADASCFQDAGERPQKADQGAESIPDAAVDAAPAEAPWVVFSGVDGPLAEGAGVDAYEARVGQLKAARRISPERAPSLAGLLAQRAPRYEPDGSRLLLVSTYRQAYQEALLITPCEEKDCTSDVTPLLADAVQVLQAEWSPRGDYAVLATEHELFIVPIDETGAGAPVRLSEHYAAPPASQPHAWRFLAGGDAIAYRTDPDTRRVPKGLSLADVRQSLARGQPVTFPMSVELAEREQIGRLVASPSGAHLAFTVDPNGEFTDRTYVVDVEGVIGSGRDTPLLLQYDDPEAYLLQSPVASDDRVWLQAKRVLGPLSTPHGGYVAYRWDGTDPRHIRDYAALRTQPSGLPSNGTATCGKWAVAPLADEEAPADLLILEMGASEAPVVRKLETGLSLDTPPSFSDDCQHALYVTGDETLVLLELPTGSVATAAGSSPRGRFELDASRRWLLHAGNTSFTFYRIDGNQLLPVLTSAARSPRLTDRALYFIQTNLDVDTWVLQRLALDAQDATPSALTPVVGSELAAQSTLDRISFVGSVSRTGPRALWEVEDGSTRLRLAAQRRPVGTVRQLAPVGRREVVIEGQDGAGSVSLHAVRVGGDSKPLSLIPAGHLVSTHALAPSGRWIALTTHPDQGEDAAPSGTHKLTLVGTASDAPSAQILAHLELSPFTVQALGDDFVAFKRADTTLDVLATEDQVRPNLYAGQQVLRIYRDGELLLRDGKQVHGANLLTDATSSALTSSSTRVQDAWLSPDREWMLFTEEVTDSADSPPYTVKGRRADNGEEFHFLAESDVLLPRTPRVQLAPDGSFAFITSASPRGCGPLLIALRSSRRIHALEAPTDDDCTVTFSRDGTRFAFASRHAVHTARSDEPLSVHDFAVRDVHHLALSSDGRWLAFARGAPPEARTQLQDLNAPDSPAQSLVHASPRPGDTFAFDGGGTYLLTRYVQGWEQGFAVWPLEDPSRYERVAPAGWTLTSARWAP